MAAGGVAHRGGPFHRWSRAAARSEDTIPDGRANNTSTLTETEMMNNRPTPNRLGQSSTPPARPATVEHAAGAAGDRRADARRRGDRSHHLVHQHIESDGDAR
jgi:hypothetical protein